MLTSIEVASQSMAVLYAETDSHRNKEPYMERKILLPQFEEDDDGAYFDKFRGKFSFSGDRVNETN